MDREKQKPKRSQIMTSEEIANYLGLHKITVYRLIKEGRLPAFKVGGQWRARKDFLDRWLLRGLTVKKIYKKK